MVTRAFTVLWVATAATTITAPLSVHAAHIGPTHYCIFDRVKSYGSSGIIAGAVYDTLVLLATSAKLLVDSPWISASDRFKVLFSSEGMGYVSKAVMHGGQQYYLYANTCLSSYRSHLTEASSSRATVGLNIATTAVLLSASVPPAYSGIMPVLSATFSNTMATRAFRKLKLRLLDAPVTFSSPPSVPLRFRTTREIGTGSVGSGHEAWEESQTISMKDVTGRATHSDAQSAA